MTRKLLALAGIGRDRLHLYWCSSAEAQRFSEIAAEVTESIRSQGKFDPGAHQRQLDAVEAVLGGETLRWTVGKQVRITTKGDVYGRPWDSDTFERILDDMLDREYRVQIILQAIKGGCRSPREVNAEIGLPLHEISHLLSDMEKRSLVVFKGMEDRKPVFEAC